jgi:peptide/nickel transport system permease protein
MTDLLTKIEPVKPRIAASRPHRPANIRFFLHRPGLLLSALLTLAVLAAAFVPAIFTSADPLTGVPRDKFQGPSLQHLFGTDQLGRDLFTRVVYGTSLSLKAMLIAVAVGFVIGAIVGLIAGFTGGWLDDVIMRVVDVLLAIPALLLALAFVVAFGFGSVNVAVAVGLASVARFARVTRAEVLRVRTTGYVEAAKAAGVRWYGILGRHVLPNAIGPAIVFATLELGSAILAVSSLSFLGYGAPPPAPEWGSLVSDGRNYLAVAWWLTVLPGLVVALTVLAANRIARALDGEWGSRT